jgi:Ca2+-binding EF-hand superfamily protein
MSEEDEKQKLSSDLTRLEYILNNTAIIPIFFLLIMFRPAEGYIQRIEFLIFLIEKEQPHEYIFIPQIVELLPLLLIIPLMFYRERVSTGINKFVRSQIAKQAIQEFDKDGDETLSKKEYPNFFSVMMENFEEEEKKDIDSDALFDKYDSNKDGKLEGDEIYFLILEVFDCFRTEEADQESSSVDEPVKMDSGEDEMQKLDKLYKEGYLSEERYGRLKQDLSR